jgi:lysine 2,3-aminomutase
MEAWQQSLRATITTPQQLADRFGIDPTPLQAVCDRYPLGITPYYAGLIKAVGDPIWRQCVPDPTELEDRGLPADPLAEEQHSPVPAIVHRYPDRALLLAGNSCAGYCRFCTRKRRIGRREAQISFGELQQGVDYIARTPQIRDVLISGGDPLLLTDSMLDELLGRIRAIPHVELIRIGTRMPVVLPERITEKLCAVLKKHAPLFINTHFNHPHEQTVESWQACSRLVDSGVVLGNQTVLLKGVNDDTATLLELNRNLLQMRVRPYYLHQMDLTAGTGHFRTTLQQGCDLVHSLRGKITGMGIPQYVIDLPGGKGKVPVNNDYVESWDGDPVLRAPDGSRVGYRQG